MTRRTPRAKLAPIADRPSTFRPRLELLEGRNLPSFASPVQTSLSAVVPGAAVGDFNGDGRQDLVAEGNGVRVLLSRGNGTFLFDQTHATGAGSKVASGDFNRDGKLDIVVSANLPTVGTYAKVFLGDGAGKFRSTSATTLRGVPLVEPSFLVSGDFNRDGVMDVAVAGEDNSPGPVRRGAVYVLLGKGDGGLLEPVRYTVGVPTGMTSGDVTGDGLIDLVVFTEGTPNVFVLKGLGDGHFSDPVPSPLPVHGTVRPTLADFDKDGKADLAFVATDGTVSTTLGIARGTAAGTFASATRTLLPGATVSRLLADDFTGDGTLDLIALGSEAQLLHGTGNNTFGTPVPVVLGAFPGNGVVGDFDGDSHPDVAGFDAQGPISVALNRPAVTLQVDLPGAAVSGTTYRVTVTAANASGTADPSYTGKVRFATTDPTAGLPAEYQFTASDRGVHTFDVTLRRAGMQTVTVSDPNRTNLQGTARANVTAVATQTPLTFAQPRFTVTALGATAVATGDFNADGKLDMAVANTGHPAKGVPGVVTVSLGNGDGTYRTAVRLPGGSSNPTAVVVADFNADGRLDVASAGFNPYRGVGHEGDVTVHLGVGNGTFRPLSPLWIRSPGNPLTASFALTRGDFNGDGWADLALSSVGSLTAQVGGSVQILLNRRDGTFAAPGQPLAVHAPTSIAAADFNGDGRLDVAAGSALQDPTILGPTPRYHLLVAMGNGSGGLNTPAKIDLGGPVNSVVTGDFNADGKPDVAAISEAAHGRTAGVQVLLNQGNGNFAAPVKYDGGPDPDSLLAVDLNADGRLDLAVVNGSSGKVQVLRGASNGTFAAGGVFFAGNGPRGIAAGDVNGDGTTDLVVPSAGTPTLPGHRVAVLLNGGIAQLQFSAGSFTANARAGQAVITVTRTGDLSGQASVRYATYNGTAIAGVDFRSAAGVLTFQAGQATKTFTVQLLPTAVGKPTRTARLVLSDADGATMVVGPSVGLLNIVG